MRTTNGSSFAPLGFRFGKQPGSLSAVPVIPIQDTGGKPKIYSTAVGKVQRANLDGSGVEDVDTGLRSPLDLALDLGN